MLKSSDELPLDLCQCQTLAHTHPGAAADDEDHAEDDDEDDAEDAEGDAQDAEEDAEDGDEDAEL